MPFVFTYLLYLRKLYIALKYSFYYCTGKTKVILKSDNTQIQMKMKCIGKSKYTYSLYFESSIFSPIPKEDYKWQYKEPWPMDFLREERPQLVEQHTWDCNSFGTVSSYWLLLLSYICIMKEMIATVYHYVPGNVWVPHIYNKILGILNMFIYILSQHDFLSRLVSLYG